MTLFFAALLFGIVFCLSPGAVLAETLRRGLKGGFRPALVDWPRRNASPRWHRVSHGLCGVVLLVLALRGI